MDSHEERISKQKKPNEKKQKIEGKQTNNSDHKREKNIYKSFRDCSLDDFFLTGNLLNYKQLDELDDAIKNWNFKKCKKNLEDYFKSEQKIEKTIRKAHRVIAKFIEDKIKPMLFQAYLEILQKNVEKVKKLCAMKEIEKLQKQIHDYDYPFFCGAFGIKIPNNKVDKLLKIYANEGIFSSGFKLIQITGSEKDKKRVSILVNGARRDELKNLVSDLMNLGYHKQDFPQVNDDLLTDSAFFFLKKEGYQYAEQIFRPHPAVLAKLVDYMMSNKMKKINQALSICSRNPQVIPYLKNSKKIKKELDQFKHIIPNPLQTNVFAPSNSQKFLTFSDFGLTKKDVLFLNENHPAIEKTLERLFSEDIIGIDTESLVARTKFDSDLDLVATLQIANSKQAYLLDPMKANKPNLIIYLRNFVENPNKIIVGHTVNDDLKLLLNSYGIKQHKCKVIELKDIFEQLYPEERKGLANMCEKILGKPICKNYTLTDWGRRPLLLNQIHYAAMDAFIVIVLFKKMEEMLNKKKKE